MAYGIAAKDVVGSSVQLAVLDEGSAVLVPIVAEEANQRQTLLGAFAPLPAIQASLAGTLSVSGPLTASQLASAGLATSTQLPASLGPKTSANCLPVTLASDGVYVTLQNAAQASLTAIQTSVGGTLKADTVVQATSANRGAIVGTTAVNLMAPNATRRGFSVQNQSTTATVYISSLATATADNNSLMLAPGQYYETAVSHTGTGSVSIIASAASTPVYAREW